MDLTDEQYSYLARFEHGLVWEWFADDDADVVVRWLMDKDYLEPREYVQPGLIVLSERGKQALEAKRKADAKRKTEKKEQRRSHWRDLLFAVIGAGATECIRLLIECFKN